MAHRRRAWLAALLNIVSVGLGHMYCGKLKKGILFGLSALILGNIILALLIYWDLAPFNILLPLVIIIAFWAFLLIDSWKAAGRHVNEFTPRSYNSPQYYFLYFLVFFILSWFSLPVFGTYQSFKMPASSMEDFLYPGEFFLSEVGGFENHPPARGEILIFIFPGDGATKYVKRCVGLSGDTVQIVDKQLLVNGHPALEPPTVKFIDTTESGEQKIQPRRTGGLDSRDNFGPYVVPYNHYFMLGDNRDNSYDSRFWGAVHRDLIIGSPRRTYYSPNVDRIGLRIY
ncbi:MAG: signal peptidase I [Candidatus Zixiibacteriota bacterium]